MLHSGLCQSPRSGVRRERAEHVNATGKLREVMLAHSFRFEVKKRSQGTRFIHGAASRPQRRRNVRVHDDGSTSDQAMLNAAVCHCPNAAQLPHTEKG